MNVLFLDFGLRKIGVAFGSLDSQLALPRPLLLRDDSLLVHLSQIVRNDNISLILVGFPYLKDGGKGSICLKIEEFVKKLKNTFSVDIQLYDEKYSTIMAERKLSKAGIKIKHQKYISDSVAAQILLQEWMDDN